MLIKLCLGSQQASLDVPWLFGGQVLRISWKGPNSDFHFWLRLRKFCRTIKLICLCSFGEQIAEETIDLKSKELETVTKKLGSADALNDELKHTMHKLQQEVLKLRGALEQSITNLNRMSSDSDFYVDRFSS